MPDTIIPGQKLSSLDMMDQEEKQQILEVFNKPGIVSDGISVHHWQLHELFAKQVKQGPDRMAVVGPGQPDNTNALVSLTYRELNKRSDPVAEVLREKGVQADTIVGIKVERSLDMMIGILGILKAGGAYLPIDPAYPQERIHFILEDSGARILLSEGLHFDVLSSHRGTFTSSFLSSSYLPSSLAYILYTSGTTGNPKGVMVEHANVINVVNWFARTFHVEVGTHLLQLTVYTFDPSVEKKKKCQAKNFQDGSATPKLRCCSHAFLPYSTFLKIGEKKVPGYFRRSPGFLRQAP